MSRKTKTAEPAIETIVVEAAQTESRALVVWEPETPEQEAADDAEIDEQIEKPASVVPRKYKLRYKERAKANGHRSKAAKRSNWDWLAQALAAELLNKQSKIDVEKLVALLVANGEPDPLGRWPNRSTGWEGRLRMTGGIWLRRVVAEEGVLHLADGEELVPPAEWIAKNLS